MPPLCCGSSKRKNKPTGPKKPIDEIDVPEPKASEREIDPRAYNQQSWSKADPLPSPYPQGQIELKKLIDEDHPSIIEPSPELIPYKVEGYWVKKSEVTF